MARKIIQLERLNAPSDRDYRVAFWLDVPVAQQQFRANPAAKSAVIGIAPEELAAIQSGAVLEVVEVLRSQKAQTQDGFQAVAQDRANKLQAQLEPDDSYDHYGTYFDGAAWVPVKA